MSVLNLGPPSFQLDEDDPEERVGAEVSPCRSPIVLYLAAVRPKRALCNM